MIRFHRHWVSLWVMASALTLCSACRSSDGPAPVLGSAQVVADFDSYTLRRVGLVPLEGLDPSLAESREMATALAMEFASKTSLEVLVLSPSEMSQVSPLKPHRDGGFDLDTIINLGKRHRLDALLVGTVVERQSFSPQRLSIQLDFVSTETGMSLWFGQVQADASEGRTQAAAKGWIQQHEQAADGDWRVVLLSPKRFFRFACNQMISQFVDMGTQAAMDSKTPGKR